MVAPSKISDLAFLLKYRERADISDGHNEDRGKRDGGRTATGATGIGDSSKHTASTVNLNERAEGVLQRRYNVEVSPRALLAVIEV